MQRLNSKLNSFVSKLSSNLFHVVVIRSEKVLKRVNYNAFYTTLKKSLQRTTKGSKVNEPNGRS